MTLLGQTIARASLEEPQRRRHEFGRHFVCLLWVLSGLAGVASAEYRHGKRHDGSLRERKNP